MPAVWSAPFEWTDERTDQLKELWANGRSASEIAKEIGCPSRNAVIGKVHRLNLAPRDRKITRKPAYVPGARKERKARAFPAGRHRTVHHSLPEDMRKSAQTRMEEAAERRVAFANEQPLESGGVTILDLETSSCRWPHGDPGDLETFRYCGTEVEGEGQPYCSCHAAMAYKPAVARVRGAA